MAEAEATFEGLVGMIERGGLLSIERYEDLLVERWRALSERLSWFPGTA